MRGLVNATKAMIWDHRFGALELQGSSDVDLQARLIASRLRLPLPMADDDGIK